VSGNNVNDTKRIDINSLPELLQSSMEAPHESTGCHLSRRTRNEQ
jgi:hypothetical protein